MNNKKFAIIIHTTTGKTQADVRNLFANVTIPKGFSFDVFLINGNEQGKYEAYNVAMRKSKAKYKLYINENVVITNKNFLIELLRLFQSDKNIGMVGASGALELSTHGVCARSFKRGGKFFAGTKEPKMQDWKNFGAAEILDSLFIATQYDISWRSDLFRDDYFGEQAQCVEFKRKGYKVVIAQQDMAWLWYKIDNFNFDEPSRQKFLDEYSKDLFPLVSIIIPTFNRPKYFKEALDSALNQTYRNIEVFISDNSIDDATEILIQEYLAKDKRVKYVRHKNFDADDNWNFARSYNNPAAEYVNWLMDDDLFYPTKLEKMIEVYRRDPDIALVTSARNFIDTDGKIISNTQDVFGKNIKLSGSEAGKLLFTFKNFIGEPTTALIKKKFLRDNDLCRNAEEKGFFTLVDVSTWLQILTQGSMFRFIECLSALRTHNQQASYSKKVYKRAPYDYAKLLKQAWEEKFFLDKEMDFKKSVSGLLWESSKRLNNLYKAGVYDKDVEILEKVAAALAQSLVNGCKIDLPPLE